ncbi:MAG: hypothetical protein AAFY71_06460 [Bacteroidota bacterium]
MDFHFPSFPKPISIDLIDEQGEAYPRRRRKGKEWIAVPKGSQYAIRLRNPNTPTTLNRPTPRIYLIVCVDGVNIGTMQWLEWDKISPSRGRAGGFVWFAEPTVDIQEDEIIGWMLSAKEVQKFRCVGPEQSVLAERFPQIFEGAAADRCGTIEIGFFIESTVHMQPQFQQTRGFSARSAGTGMGDGVANPYEINKGPFRFKSDEPDLIASITYRPGRISSKKLTSSSS